LATALTPEGLVIQRLNDILLTQRELAVELFKDITPEGEDVDTSANTTIGRLISLAAPATADLWEAMAEVYAAFDPESATGIALDKLVSLGGIERLRATKASCQALMTGDLSTVIPMLSTIRGVGTGLLWQTRSPLTLSTTCSGVNLDITTVADSTVYSITYTSPSGTKVLSYTSDGSATETEISNGLIAASLLAPHNTLITVTKLAPTQSLNIIKQNAYDFGTFTPTANLTIDKYQKVVALQAQETGAVEQAIGTITNIATPVLGWDSAVNITAASGGRDVESDVELRVRFANTKYEKATNTLEALYSAIINAEGVTEVIIYENDTAVTDANGLPPHSFMVIAAGGYDPQTLAQIIWENKPLGILAFTPSTYLTVYDSQGLPHLIGVKAPELKPLYISMTLATDATFPANGEEDIKAALVDYLTTNFGIGDDITYSRLFTPINSVVGHSVTSLTIGLSASPVGTSNVVIDFDEIHTIDTNNIIITS